MNEKVHHLPEPDLRLMRQHVELITQGMGDYCDGRIEIAYGNHENIPNHAQTFAIDQIDEIIVFAAQKNKDRRNIYIVGAVLSPDTPADRRSNDSHFYGSGVAWCDIDNDGKDALTAEQIKAKFKKLPPTIVVVTGTKPNIRTHLWWKLAESTGDPEELREMLEGLQVNLGGDPAVKNVTSLMRLGGSINWQTEKKRSRGREIELVEIKTTAGAKQSVYAEALLHAYPVGQQAYQTYQSAEQPQAHTAQPSGIGLKLEEKYADNREAYMHEMLCATIVHLTEKLKQWPTPDEVFNDAWPVYLRKVEARDGRSLDQDNRGQSLMRSKIKSKLSAFMRGRIRNAESVEAILKAYKAKGGDSSGQNTGQKESEEQSQESGNKEENGQSQQDKIPDFKLTDWIASNRYTGTAQPISWLVEGVFPKGVPVLLAAMGGLGKSFIALDMAIKIAQPPSTIGAHKVLGRDVKAHGKAVLLTAEDSFESIHRRINALTNEETLKRTLGNLIIIPMSEIEASQLLVKEGRAGLEMTEVFHELKKQLHEIKDLKFIGIDPLQAFVGADITAKPEAAQFMWSAFAKIASQTGATFFATHHMRKDGMGEIRTAADAREGIRGTTGLVDGARAVYVMWQAVNDIGEAIARKIDQPYEPHRYIQGSVVKANDEADHSVMSFYRKDDGLLFCLGTLDLNDQVRESGKLSANQEAILKAIKNALTIYGRLVTPHQGQKPVMAISFDDLRKQLEAEGYKEFLRKEGDTDREVAVRAKNATTYARNTLVKRGIIGQQSCYIWLLEVSSPAQKEEESVAPRRVAEEFKNEFD